MEVEVRSREEKYRGKTLAFLKSLDIRESAKFMTARSRRSILRHFEVVDKFIKTCEKKEARGKRVRTHMRDIIIVPKLVGKLIGVYNGKTFQDVTITVDMIGHRLGEFAATRKRVAHSAAGIGATKSSRALKK